MLINSALRAWLVSTVLLAGCTGDNDNFDAAELGNDLLETGTDLDDILDANSQFNGNFLRGCSLADDPANGFEINEVAIQGDSFVTTVSQFADAQCTLLNGVFVFDSTLVFPGDTVDTPLGVADFIDITVDSLTLNGESVIDNSFEDFDLILLDGNNLLFGDDSGEFDGETRETRPVEIDEDFVLMRV